MNDPFKVVTRVTAPKKNPGEVFLVLVLVLVLVIVLVLVLVHRSYMSYASYGSPPQFFGEIPSYGVTPRPL